MSERLSTAIILLAATFTLAWMQRNNEIILILSAGIPTRRVLRPLLLGCLMMVGASLANREWLIPQIADHLELSSSDPRGEAKISVRGAYEPNDILISGRHAFREEMVVKEFRCTIPEKIAGRLLHITADEARYIPPSHEQPSGGWLMTGTHPPEPEWPSWDQPILQIIDRGKFFLRTERVDFDLVTRTRNWYLFASTLDLLRELATAKSARFVALAVQLHMRLTAPLLTLILIGAGVSILLKDQHRNVFLSAGMCLLVVAIYYGLNFIGRFLGEAELLPPALAAWIPVFLFGPFALVSFDTIQT